MLNSKSLYRNVLECVQFIMEDYKVLIAICKIERRFPPDLSPPFLSSLSALLS